MLTILFTILPVFLVMGAGYLGVKSGYVAETLGDALSQFAVRFAVPVLLFRAMVELDFAHAFNVKMLIAFYGGAVLSFLLGLAISRVVFSIRPGEAVAIGFGAMFSNSALLGIPLSQRVFGDEVMPLVFGIIAIHAATLYAIGIVSMELARRDGIPLSQAFVKSGKSIVSNSLMIGVACGTLVNLSGFTLPEPVMAAVNMIAASAIPVALIGIGAALTRFKLGEDFRLVMLITVLSLLVHPAIAFFLSHQVFGLDPVYVMAAVIISAMPPGTNIYIFAVMYNRATNIAASAILVATMLSILTISAWVALIHSATG